MLCFAPQWDHVFLRDRLGKCCGARDTAAPLFFAGHGRGAGQGQAPSRRLVPFVPLPRYANRDTRDDCPVCPGCPPAADTTRKLAVIAWVAHASLVFDLSCVRQVSPSNFKFEYGCNASQYRDTLKDLCGPKRPRLRLGTAKEGGHGGRPEGASQSP
jgi:hypothetical protein